MLSKEHIELHPILFDQHEDAVPPLLYVKCLSRNSIDVQKHTLDSSFLVKVKLAHQSAPYLLNNHDIVRVSPVVHVKVTFCRASEDTLSLLQREERKSLCCDYILTDQLIGSGSHGKVVVAYHGTSCQQVACKIIDLHSIARTANDTALKSVQGESSSIHFTEQQASNEFPSRHHLQTIRRRILEKQLAQCRAEIAIQSGLAHPNIASFGEAYITTHSIFIFQELITGGDLYSYLESKAPDGLRDSETALIIRQVLEAVRYLHNHHVVHRDIKPENIQLTTWHPGGRIVLNDFGLAKCSAPCSTANGSKLTHRMHTEVGTLDYAAPEVGFHGRRQNPEGYDSSVDIWSIGAVTAMLLTAEFPSKSLRTRPTSGGQDQPEADYDLSALDSSQHPVWGAIAARPKSFLKLLLDPDPSGRPSAEQALQHSWFNKRLYKHDMDAIYEKAISGWQPIPASTPRFVDTRHLGPGPLDDESIHQGG